MKFRADPYWVIDTSFNVSLAKIVTSAIFSFYGSIKPLKHFYNSKSNKTNFKSSRKRILSKIQPKKYFPFKG